jgi:hypothetical protein
MSIIDIPEGAVGSHGDTGTSNEIDVLSDHNNEASMFESAINSKIVRFCSSTTLNPASIQKQVKKLKLGT